QDLGSVSTIYGSDMKETFFQQFQRASGLPLERPDDIRVFVEGLWRAGSNQEVPEQPVQPKRPRVPLQHERAGEAREDSPPHRDRKSPGLGFLPEDRQLRPDQDENAEEAPAQDQGGVHSARLWFEGDAPGKTGPAGIRPGRPT